MKINGRKVGYLPREQAARVADQMRGEGQSAAACSARVRGGWRTNQYGEGHYGVQLAIPRSGWIDFGIGSTPPPVSPSPRKEVRRRPKAAAAGPLIGQSVALMGAATDGDVAQELASAGAHIMAGLGKSTTLLVVAGETPFPFWIRRSSTYRQAEKLIVEGASLRIVSLSEARAMISEA